MFSVNRFLVFLTGAQILTLVFGMLVLHNIESTTLATAAGEASATLSPVTKIVTVVWMSGFFAAVNWLVITKILNPVDDELQAKQEKTLLAMNELVRTRDAIIFGLAKLAESRDPETGQHLERISMYSVRLATAMRKDPRFRDEINSEFVRMIGISSVLHDIGKVGIPDSLLLKRGPLTDEERTRIQIHPKIGEDCIHQIERRLGNSDFLAMAREIALCHHEWWNGEGYPHGTSMQEIPLAARIVAIADVYDALASRRVYKKSFSHEQCVEEIRSKAGTHFDPNIVEVFDSISEQFADIAARFVDRHKMDLMSFAEAELVDHVVTEETPSNSTGPQAVTSQAKEKEVVEERVDR